MFYCTVELLQAKLRVCYVYKNEGWNLKKKNSDMKIIRVSEHSIVKYSRLF